MKLVAWNAAWNTRKHSHEHVEELLATLAPDVAVVSETCCPAVGKASVHWSGPMTPGLSVYTSGPYRISPAEARSGTLRHFRPFNVSGHVSFKLFAVWPTTEDAKTYHQVLMRGLELYRDVIESGRVILAGDFNSNTKVQTQRQTHPKFVRAAEALGLVSVYHAAGDHAHGAEPEATYLRGASDGHNAGFHIDYCFVSRDLLPGAKAEVGSRENWRPHSDHLPLVVVIPDDNFNTVAT